MLNPGDPEWKTDGMLGHPDKCPCDGCEAHRKVVAEGAKQIRRLEDDAFLEALVKEAEDKKAQREAHNELMRQQARQHRQGR